MKIRKIRLTPIWNTILKTSSVGMLNKVISVLISLILIPLLIKYIGNEKYGLWMAISALGVYIRLLDFGLASAMTNNLTHAFAKQDHKRFNKLIGNGLVVEFTIMAIILILFLIYKNSINVISIFKLNTINFNEANSVLLIFVAVTLLILPFSIIQKIPYTIQKGYITETYLIIGNLITFILTISIILMKLSFLLIVFVLSLSQIISSVFILIHLFSQNKLRLNYKDFLPEKSILLLFNSQGAYFTLYLVGMTIISSGGILILANIKGASAVVPYGIMFQLYLAVQTPILSIQQPLWTAIAKERSLNNLSSIKNIFYKYLKISTIYSIIAVLFFILFSNFLIHMILKKQILISFDLKLAFAIQLLFANIVGVGMITLILALGLTRQNAIISILQVAIFLLTAVYLIPRFDAVGAVWCIISTYIVTLPGSFWLLKKYLYSGKLKTFGFISDGT